MVQLVEHFLDLQYTSVLATGFHATADLPATCLTELSPGHTVCCSIHAPNTGLEALPTAPVVPCTSSAESLSLPFCCFA